MVWFLAKIFERKCYPLKSTVYPQSYPREWPYIS